jgi:hypothetical protein
MQSCCCRFSPPQLGAANAADALWDLPQPHEYVSNRASSFDRRGANQDSRPIPPGQTLTILDFDGPGVITHIWTTIASQDPDHLKQLVLRAYWDGEDAPSVESLVGDFFGLGLGQYISYQSTPLSVAPDKALNCFFRMPFRKHARITLSNEGPRRVDALYYNIDYQSQVRLPPDTLYFHAEYRQAAPARGWASPLTGNGDPLVNDRENPDGHDNYVWLEASGRGQFVGVTMSVLQNQDYW